MQVSMKLLSDIAHEAHIMGRVYTKGGEIVSPAVEFERVDAMVEKKLSAHQHANTRECESGAVLEDTDYTLTYVDAHTVRFSRTA